MTRASLNDNQLSLQFLPRSIVRGKIEKARMIILFQTEIPGIEDLNYSLIKNDLFFYQYIIQLVMEVVRIIHSVLTIRSGF